MNKITGPDVKVFPERQLKCKKKMKITKEAAFSPYYCLAQYRVISNFAFDFKKGSKGDRHTESGLIIAGRVN